MLQVTGLSLVFQVKVAKSVEIQLTLEDSGSQGATSLGYSINDETCEVAGTFMLHYSVLSFLYIDYKMPPNTFQVPLYCPLCEVPAPVRKVTVRGLCELSIFDK